MRLALSRRLFEQRGTLRFRVQRLGDVVDICTVSYEPSFTCYRDRQGRGRYMQTGCDTVERLGTFLFTYCLHDYVYIFIRPQSHPLSTSLALRDAPAVYTGFNPTL